MQIDIIVQSKIARPLDPKCFIVCGNSDYIINFSFDEEWAEHEAKTARFEFGGKYIDVVFTGNQCPAPILSNTVAVGIGVFAGDLHTTTPAIINCRKSALCGGGLPAEPAPDVYAQIMEQINAGMLQGAKGEKGDKGDKGDAGSIKFIPVTELPTENIDDSAIYLVPVADSTDENRFTEYVYINGQWEAIGAITVQVDHSEYVKFTDYATTAKAGVAKYYSDYGISITASGYPYIVAAQNAEIDEKTSGYKSLTPKSIDHAVKVGVTTNTETLTNKEKIAVAGWIGTEAQNIGSTLVRRYSSGNIAVPLNPTAEVHATSKYYVDETFAPKISNATGELRVWVSNGKVGYWTSSQSNAASAAPNRYSMYMSETDGDNAVTGYMLTNVPTRDYQSANKKYVDDLIAKLRAEIEALKG